MAEIDQPRSPWTDERLEAAFAATAPAVAPPGVLTAVHRRLDDDTARNDRWRRPAFAMAGTAIALTAVVALAVTAGPILVRRGPVIGAQFRVEPGVGGTSAFVTEAFRFDFPSAWTPIDAGGPTSGSNSFGVLSTLAVPAKCQPAPIALNCIEEQPLEPGTMRLVVSEGSGFGRNANVTDRSDIENGITTRLTVAGMPAILDDIAVGADDVDHSTLSLRLTVAIPTSLSTAVTLDLIASDPGSTAVRRQFEALIASFAFTPPGATLPPDDARGIELARLAMASADAEFRRGWSQPDGENHLGCQPDEPAVARDAVITFSSGGDLGGGVPVTCSWTLDREGGVFWRVETHVDWTVDGRSGRATEILWLDADGSIVDQRDEGENPPAAPAPTAAATLLGLPVLTVDEALAGPVETADGREFAVRGWLTSREMMVRCAYGRAESPLLPRCGEGLVYLLRDNQAIPRTTNGVPPTGPFLNPLIRGSVDLDTLGAEPQDAILVGHVADPRAAFCPADRRAECEAAFIVDRVLPATGGLANDPAPWLTSSEPPRAATDVWAYLATLHFTAERPLSIGLVEPTELATLQPALTGVAGPGTGPVWIVEVLWGGGTDPGHRTTVIVPDAAIDEGRRILTIIIDGVVQPGVMTSE